MKQTIYFFALIAFAATPAVAQLSAGMLAMPVVKNGATPVDINLTAHTAKNIGEVSWQALKQVKVRRYELEKSADGENFTYVTAVADGSNAKDSYTVEDRNLQENNNYYRLKIIDNEGSYVYSKVISLDAAADNNSAASIKVIPAIVSDVLYVWLPANTQISHAEITDAAGRKISSSLPMTHITNVASLPVEKLATGIYKINITTNTGVTTNLKFSKK
jgi:hypothetical protein